VKELASQIYAAVRSGRLKEPFGPAGVRRACSGWGRSTYQVFLPKHRVGNPGKTSELFEQTSRGRYCTLAGFRLDPESGV
jgi:hypothetical protein